MTKKERLVRDWLADFATGMQGDSYYVIHPDDVYDDDVKEIIELIKSSKPKLNYHRVFLKNGTNYVCQCKTRTKDHAWRKDTL